MSVSSSDQHLELCALDVDLDDIGRWKVGLFRDLVEPANRGDEVADVLGRCCPNTFLESPKSAAPRLRMTLGNLHRPRPFRIHLRDPIR
jgi:hypothetical protein